MKSFADELKAAEAIYEALTDFDPAMRARLINLVNDRFARERAPHGVGDPGFVRDVKNDPLGQRNQWIRTEEDRSGAVLAVERGASPS